MKKKQKTFQQRKEDVQRDWYMVNVDDKILGRVATKIAQLLIGKNKPTYTPHTDAGDYVVVTNAQGVKVTRNKAKRKIYFHHSGYPGGLKSETYEDLFARAPEKIIEKAVWGMLPKNKLRKKRFARLKVYKGNEHPHTEVKSVKNTK